MTISVYKCTLKERTETTTYMLYTFSHTHTKHDVIWHYNLKWDKGIENMRSKNGDMKYHAIFQMRSRSHFSLSLSFYVCVFFRATRSMAALRHIFHFHDSDESESLNNHTDELKFCHHFKKARIIDRDEWEKQMERCSACCAWSISFGIICKNMLPNFTCLIMDWN